MNYTSNYKNRKPIVFANNSKKKPPCSFTEQDGFLVFIASGKG